MRLAGIAAVFPSRVVTNDDILDMIDRESRPIYRGDLRGPTGLARVRHLLAHSGISSRKWSSAGEAPIQMLAEAISRAVEEGGCTHAEVDLLIYTGVGGGFSEPGNSYMIAHALGMKRTQCFDIRDACNSWSRASQLLYSIFRMDRSTDRALIVNAEFNMYEGGPCNPHLFRLRSPEDLDSCFPAYTIGEAATAALFVRDPTRRWDFHFSSRADLADLCTVPEGNYEGYCAIGLGGGNGGPAERLGGSGARIGRNGPHRFTSFGSELSTHGPPEAIDVFRKLGVEHASIKKIFPHASSKRDWDAVADVVGARVLLFHIYPEYGNVVSASVPAGIALAKESGEIEPGDRLVTWVASAGMSFSASTFVL